MISGKEAKNLQGILLYEISGKEFCVNISQIAHIINPMDPDVRMIHDKDGRTLLQTGKNSFEVIDICMLYKEEGKEKAKDARILIVKISGLNIAVYTDRIIEIISFTSKDMEQKIKFVRTENDKYMSGYFQYNDKQFKLPNYLEIAEAVYGFMND